MITWIFLFLSLAAVVVGAEILVNGSVAIAKRYKISDFIIGATIIGIGTSCPELVVSLVGALGGNADIAIGNVVGSNICNVLLILGMTALIAPVSITKDNLRFELPYCIFLSFLLMLLTFNFFNGSTALLNRPDGWILLAFFLFYLYWSFRRNRKENELAATKTDVSEISGSLASKQTADKEDTSSTKLYGLIFRVIAGLALLVIGSHFFVEEAVVLARRFGVSDAFISITLLAVGTSLPELAASVASAAKKNTQLALGNIIGSNIFNISFILGSCTQVLPLKATGINMVDYAVMIVAALLPLLFAVKGKINRFGSLLMLFMYVVYIIYMLEFK